MGPVTPERRDHQISIRIPRRIREAIAAQAVAERRSFADVVNNIFEQHFPAPRNARSRSQ